ncbi:phospholipase A [Acinetobacter portensis]|uniref:Phospholipase A1 n=1 Tax=Acinetobacter portensis TaxID=1839785 RepID=A0ABY4JRX8_9GAMM|nr:MULTISPECIES: phospholipase A [Acinetobacter]MCK7607868.1 phospholipase A [Acinetobacter portensis]MCK7638618.1 phospholipase A [Acinetobacter portensis]MDY6458430.1 phospholipase A [Acinetobacter faecalis]MDY6523682.1 phospholipase A [Acinetobacter faecalis]MDY6535353.1 phospholipase A [Acinetobacter faecalis]
MPFQNKPVVLGLSTVLLGSASMMQLHAAGEISPASADACVALQSNADRLACYDALFKVPTTDVQPLVSEREAALSLSSETDSFADKIKNNVVAVEAATFTPNTSLLDSRWELSPESKLGTWQVRAYQPVYVLPAFWTSKKHEQPTSGNSQNVISPDEAMPLDSTEMKYQLSLKTKAFESIFGNNGDLWVGYTQSSRWQMYNSDESRPFRETNYEPEASLMFRTNYEMFGLNGRLLGLTFNHQSNGRSDPWSRSWNRVIVNVGFERENFAMIVRPWFRISENAEDDNNPDIENYIGRGDLTAFYRYKDQDFSLMLRHSLKGGDDSRGAAQFDWNFPISGRLRGKFQLFHGYGESLIDYNHKATYVGLGVSLLDWY